MVNPRNRERVARNFIRRYGADRFQQLLEALATGSSGQEIAEQLDVTRERVRQWKNTFGQVLTIYQVHPEVDAVLKESASAKPAARKRKAAKPSSSGPMIELLLDEE